MKIVIENKHPKREDDLFALGSLLAMVHNYNDEHIDGVMQKVWRKFVDELTERVLSGAYSYSDIEFEFDFGATIRKIRKGAPK